MTDKTHASCGRPVSASIAVLLILMSPAALAGGSAAAPVPGPARITFALDPVLDPSATLEGAYGERLRWNDDAPAFPGDRPGSLEVLYRSDLPAARVGWELPSALDQGTPFVALALMRLDSSHFHADPDGFFQISWGLWNGDTSGMERTGSFAAPAADTFELMEFDYFPAVSPYFGGPWLSPTTFGEADPDSPLFELFGAFANASFGSVEVGLPLDEFLLTAIEYRPALSAAIVHVFRVVPGGLLPLEGALAVMPMASLGRPAFRFDRVGLTLWHDGYGGPNPALDALVRFDGLAVLPGRLADADGLLDALR